MIHKAVPLDEINALATEPSTAQGVESLPDVAILRIATAESDWGTQLDRVVSGCLVLGYRKIVVDLQGSSISTAFQIACLVSAWHLLVAAGGTLILSGLSPEDLAELGKEFDPTLFNLSQDVDEGIDWLEAGFEEDVRQNFPREARCRDCGSVGTVARRGDHVCDDCGMTYLVTERGELPF
jgi:hypothetical protein